MTQPDKDEIIAYNCATPVTQPDKAALAALVNKAMDEWESDQEAADTKTCAEHIAITILAARSADRVREATIEECAKIAGDIHLHTASMTQERDLAHRILPRVAKAIRALAAPQASP